MHGHCRQLGPDLPSVAHCYTALDRLLLLSDLDPALQAKLAENPVLRELAPLSMRQHPALTLRGAVAHLELLL